MKTSRQLERTFKGVANHRRIDILVLTRKYPGISLIDISEHLRCNLKTISEHTKKLVSSGLVVKQYRGRIVTHALSPDGKKVFNILRTF